MNGKTDMRCIKTRKAIRKALLTLLSEKQASASISITEVANAAMVNRKTFYAHYDDLADVVKDIESEVLNSLSRLFDSSELLDNGKLSYYAFERATNILYDDFGFYKELLRSGVNRAFTDNIQRSFSKVLLDAIGPYATADRSIVEYSVDFVAAGVMFMYQKWMCAEEIKSVEFISKAAWEFSAERLNKLFERSEQN